jgi:uncharacterized membrane protein
MSIWAVLTTKTVLIRWENSLKKLKTLIIISIILLSFFAISVPTASAAKSTFFNYFYVSPQTNYPPNQIVIVGGIDPPPPAGHVYEGIQIAMITPDSTFVSIGTVNSDAIGGFYKTYTLPSTLGQYNITISYAGAIMGSDTYSPCTTYKLVTIRSSGFSFMLFNDQLCWSQADPFMLIVNKGQTKTWYTILPTFGEFSGTVNLNIQGAPTIGSSAQFSPASITTADRSTLSISANSATPTGYYPLTVTGSSGSTTISDLFWLYVTDFNISAPATVAVKAGESKAFNILVRGLGFEFNDTVDLSITGAPTGVTCNLNASSVKIQANQPQYGYLNCVVSALGTTAGGNYPLTLTATGGGLTHTFQTTLQVQSINNSTGALSVTATSDSKSLTKGATTTCTIDVTSPSSDAVTLSATGLPSGVTAEFNPKTVTPNGTATLTLSADETATAGIYSATIKGSTGTNSSTATIAFEVTSDATPSFSLGCTTAKQTVAAGQETTFQITIAPSGGFTGNVALSVSGLPTGASASFNPATTSSGSSILTIKTQSTAEISTKTLTITGTSGALTAQTTVDLEITAPPNEFPILYIAIIIVVIVIVIAVIIILLKMRKKPNGPAQIRITAEPTSIPANGSTRSVISMQLLDKKGKPIAAPSDTQIQITAAKGTLENSTITIPKGKNSEKTAIISSNETGQVPVSANAQGLKSITITLNFTERIRYCMHCGTMMSIEDKTCKNCGKAPPAGADTKTCQNCESVIPIVAKFCSECGAGQQT